MVNISVIGGTRCSDAVYDSAVKIGTLLAGEGAVVICGGLTGVMEGVARGVRSAGGVCIGILPGSDRTSANQYLTAAIPTGIGFARNFLVVRAGDAVIAIDGDHGTASESHFALSEGKPLVLLYREDISDSGGKAGYLFHAGSEEEAVRIAMREAGKTA